MHARRLRPLLSGCPVQGRPVRRLVCHRRADYQDLLQAELSGPTWALVEMASPRAGRRPVTPIGDEPLTAVFDPIDIGLLSGSTGVPSGSGVRSYTAFYQLPRGGQIDIIDPQAIGQGCRRGQASAACLQERRFLTYLDEAERVVVRPQEMRLHKGQRVLLKFVPLDDYLAAKAAEAEAAQNGRGD